MTYPGNAERPPIIPPTPPQHEPAPQVWQAPHPAKKSHAGLIVGLVAAALALVLIAAGGTYFLFFRTTESDQAKTQCEERIKTMLKTPATAKFSNETVGPVPPNGWNVTGTLDAENSFSALVRNQWDCYAHKNADGTWDVRPSILSN